MYVYFIQQKYTNYIFLNFLSDPFSRWYQCPFPYQPKQFCHYRAPLWCWPQTCMRSGAVWPNPCTVQELYSIVGLILGQYSMKNEFIFIRDWKQIQNNLKYFSRLEIEAVVCLFYGIIIINLILYNIPPVLCWWSVSIH